MDIIDTRCGVEDGYPKDNLVCSKGIKVKH